MGSFAALYEELCRKFPDNKPRGDAFEEICQHYLRTHPAYQKELKKVWLWDKWPDRWGPDIGIDLVARTHDGDLWAVQAKAWNPDVGAGGFIVMRVIVAVERSISEKHQRSVRRT